MSALKAMNLAIRFLLELVALGALCHWGATVTASLLVQVALAIALPMAAALLWGTFVSPKARVRLPLVPRLLTGLAIFGIAALAMDQRGHAGAAAYFLAVAVVNVLLMLAWRQDQQADQQADRSP